MNEDVIADLKQFIVGTITQQTADIRLDVNDLRRDIQQLDKRVGSLETKVDDGFSAIAVILENMNIASDVTEAQLKDHSKRLTYLEQRLV